jgi:hypothetical protein
VKVSLARLNESRELRDIALTLLDRHGSNVVLVDRERQIKTRQHHVGDLEIMQSAPMGEQILDIYQGRKVFSVNWNEVDAIDVVAFKPGDWRQTLRMAAEPLVAWQMDALKPSIGKFSSDGGPGLSSVEFDKRTQEWIAELYEKAPAEQS